MRGKTTWCGSRLYVSIGFVCAFAIGSAYAADRMGLKQPESPIEQQIVKPLHAAGGHSAEPIGPQSVGFADPGFRAERLYIDTTVIDKTNASVRDTKPLITGIAFVTTGPCEGYAFVPLIGGSVLVLDPSGQQQAVPFIPFVR